MLKILLAFPRPLVPADTGGKIRTLNIFSRLANRAEIHAVSFADPERDAAGVEEMRRLFKSYTPVCWRETAKYSLAFYAELFANQFSHLPYFIAKCCRPNFQSTVEMLAQCKRSDVLVCDFLQTGAAMLESSVRPRVVFEHNVEYLLRKRQWEREASPLRKRVFAAEWKKTRSIEARVCRSFDHVIAVSHDDRQVLEHEFGISSVSALPTGVDTEFFRPSEVKLQRGHLVFVGSMDWYPNEDGIIWFLKEVYPSVRRAVPGTSLSIVGRNPSTRLLTHAAGDFSLRVTGGVEDVRPFLAEAELVVVPLRIGGGTRIKIPEAMAMAKPVVSTTVGAAGLSLVPGREILLADEPEEFARAVVDLLNDTPRREAIVRAAREKIVRDYPWDGVAEKMKEILKQVVGWAGQGVSVAEGLRQVESVTDTNR